MKKSAGRKQRRELSRKNRVALGRRRAATREWFEKRAKQKRIKAVRRHVA